MTSSAEFTEEISTVERSVGTRTLAAGEARVQTVARDYPTDLDDLWSACTDPDRLPRWFLPVSGELRLGGRYQLEGNAGGTVEACDPPRSFSATWEFGGEVSWVTVTLTPVDATTTRFALEHVAHVDDERWAEYGPGATGVGWDGALLGLRLHLTDPDAPKPAEDSPELHPFLVASARAWEAAAVAAGDLPEHARAAADRCVAFYTGAPA